MNSIKERGQTLYFQQYYLPVGVWFDQFTKTLAVDHLKGQDPFYSVQKCVSVLNT